jgi:uroporphyrinogen decarboxylase
MNSFERYQSATRHQTPDRVPCDFSAESEIIERLLQTLGLASYADLLNALWIDRRSVGPKYIGPPLRKFEDGSYETIIRGGPVRQDIPAPDGGVIPSTVGYPWADVETPTDLEGRWGWTGSLEWWDFADIPAQIDALEEAGPYWITAHGDPSGLQHVQMWAGDEKFLLMLAENPELAHAMIAKHNEGRLEHALRTLEAGGGRIHELNGGGDYGTQNNLLISKAMFRRYFKDYYLNFYREIKKNFDVEIFFHSCGAIAGLIPELIEIGVTILNPIQVRAHGMEIDPLKSGYGERLTFHGGIDIQDLLPHGTPAEVKREVRRTIDILGMNGGYVLAPTHAFQPDIPVENILAMYEEAQGRKIDRAALPFSTH